MTESLNVAVLAKPIPASTWIAQYKSWPIWCEELSDPECWKWKCHAIVDTLHESVLAISLSIGSLDPAWADCFFDSSGMPDPLYARALSLAGQAIMPPGVGAPRPTSVPADLTAMPAKPLSTAGDGIPAKTYNFHRPTSPPSPSTDGDGSDPTKAQRDGNDLPLSGDGHPGDDTSHNKAASVIQSGKDGESHNEQDPQDNVGQKSKSHQDPPPSHKGPPDANPLEGIEMTAEDSQGSQPLTLMVPGPVQDSTLDPASPENQPPEKFYLIYRSLGGLHTVLQSQHPPGWCPLPRGGYLYWSCG